MKLLLTLMLALGVASASNSASLRAGAGGGDGRAAAANPCEMACTAQNTKEACTGLKYEGGWVQGDHKRLEEAGCKAREVDPKVPGVHPISCEWVELQVRVAYNNGAPSSAMADSIVPVTRVDALTMAHTGHCQLRKYEAGVRSGPRTRPADLIDPKSFVVLRSVLSQVHWKKADAVADQKK